jgi:hypothetical protein
MEKGHGIHCLKNDNGVVVEDDEGIKKSKEQIKSSLPSIY